MKGKVGAVGSAGWSGRRPRNLLRRACDEVRCEVRTCPRGTGSVRLPALFWSTMRSFVEFGEKVMRWSGRLVER